MNYLLEIFKALATGFIAGVVFGLLKLPIPAPSVLAGILGLFGIFLGYILVSYIRA